MNPSFINIINWEAEIFYNTLHQDTHDSKGPNLYSELYNQLYFPPSSSYISLDIYHRKGYRVQIFFTHVTQRYRKLMIHESL